MTLKEVSFPTRHDLTIEVSMHPRLVILLLLLLLRLFEDLDSLHFLREFARSLPHQTIPTDTDECDANT